MTDVTGIWIDCVMRDHWQTRYDPQMGLSVSIGNLPCLDGIDLLLKAGIESSMVSDNAARVVNAPSITDI